MTLLFDFAEDPVVHVGQILQQPLAKKQKHQTSALSDMVLSACCFMPLRSMQYIYKCCHRAYCLTTQMFYLL